MGMTGNYWRTNSENIKKIQSGIIDLTDYIFSDEQERNIIDIDKTWHAIHFTLTGDPFGGDADNIFSKLVLSGNMLENTDKEFSAMLIEADDVKKTSHELLNMTEQQFRKMFDIIKMRENEIYPIMDDEDENDFFEYVWGYLSDLKQFMKTASCNGQAVVFYIL